MTFQQDDLFKKDNSFGAAAGFVAEIHSSFPGKAATGSQSHSTATVAEPRNSQKHEEYLEIW